MPPIPHTEAYLSNPSMDDFPERLAAAVEGYDIIIQIGTHEEGENLYLFTPKYPRRNQSFTQAVGNALAAGLIQQEQLVPPVMIDGPSLERHLREEHARKEKMNMEEMEG